MGDILNINSVVICTNILDVDTVLRGNILNVNSVLVNCGETGNTWNCSATTISDTCTGTTEVTTAHSQPDMSLHFSDTVPNQGLVTTDYHYIDYTASTNSLSCLVKGNATRQLLGWALDNNGDALYASTAGGGIIHTGWSAFITALNATGIISEPTWLTAPNLALVPPFSTGVSSWSAMFDDCECRYDCNCIPISGSSGAYSSMTQCLESKNCCTECEVNSVIDLAFDADDCASACDGICEYYWTDVVSPLPCPLSLGDHIYIDDSCTPAPRGFYSPKNCASACKYCYEVGLAGEIINVTLCDTEECNIVVLYVDADGEPCPDLYSHKCEDSICKVCDLNYPIFPYTDALGSPPNLQVGDHIYGGTWGPDCWCQPSYMFDAGYYRWHYTVTGDDWCIVIGEACEITSMTLCDTLGPDDDDDDMVDIVWETDEETGYQYYDLDGYRYYDVDGDGEVDFSEPIEDKDKDKEGPDGLAPADK